MKTPLRRKRRFPKVAAESVGVKNPRMDQLKTLDPSKKPVFDKIYADYDIKKAFREQAETQAGTLKKKRKKY